MKIGKHQKNVTEAKKHSTEFSKWLLVQESALVWVLTIGCLILAYLCIKNGYTGALAWLATSLGCAYTAYGVSQSCYYAKSKAENSVGGLKYAATMAEIMASTAPNEAQESSEPDIWGEI